MALCGRALRRCALRALSKPAAAPLLCRYNQGLPNADDRTYIDEAEMFKRMYAREFLTTADMNPTTKPTRRRFGIVMCQTGYISEKNNLAMKTVLKRLLQAEGFIDHVKCDIQVTRKPAGKRMGGGKGKKAYKVAFVTPNTLIYEWDHEDRIKTEKYARRLRYLTPLRLKLITNPLPPFEKLKEDIRMKVDVSVDDFRKVVKDMEKVQAAKNLKPTGPVSLKMKGQF